MQGHYLHSKRFKNVLCVFRDGRDVMVSAYCWMLFHTDRNEPQVIERNRRRMPFDDYDNIRGNMATFIEFMFTEWADGFSRFTWAEFVRSWHHRRVARIKYERMLVDPQREMALALRQLSGTEADPDRLRRSIDRFDFQKQTGRTRGTEDRGSFLRKGVSGEWRAKFDLHARRAFAHYAGEELVLMGYAHNREYRSW